MILRAAATVLSIMLAMTTVSHAAADVSSLARDFETTKKRIEESEVKQRQVLSALYQLNKKIKKSVTERGSLSQQKVQLELSIHSLEQKVVALEDQSRSQRTLLAERLKVIYKMGGQSLARLLMGSGSSAQIERNLKILGIVAKKDLELVKNYSHDLKDLQSRKRALAVRLESFKSVEEKILKQEKNLLAEQNTKSRILDGIRKNRMFAINKINGLREQSLQFNLEDSGLFDLLFKPSFADHKGILPAPTEGQVIQRFGLIKGKDHPYTLNNKGISIATSNGAAVKSVFDGTVSFVGELPGFGQTLIVDHGDHYYSVYGKTRDVKVNLGDEVTQAQVIASTSGLYFEIRHFSEPYDPQQWMKGL